ncbi:MAG: hypothetical protein KDB32_00495 [Planctomycetes bacterium]|nr:hypothetical protein [Planctomycetota bacterium]
MASVEDIYLFRHAVYRDVAYELQLPSERSQLHTAAISIAEQFFTNELHLVAAELATHAHRAQQGASAELLDQLAQTEFKYLLMQLEHEFQRAQWQTVTDIAAHARTCAGYNEAKHGKVCQMQARALENMGRRLEAESTWLEIAEHGKEVNNSEDVVAGLCGAGLCRIVLGRHDEAAEVFASAKAYAGGNTALRAQVLMDMSMLSNNQGDFAEHERLLFEALQLIGDADSKLKTGIRGNIANMYANTNRRPKAIRELVKLLAEFEELGDTRGVATANANLGRQLMLEGDFEQAIGHLERAIELATEIGIQRSVAFALANLAEIKLRTGDLDTGRVSAEQACALADEQGLPLYHAAYTCTLAMSHLLVGHETLANELVENARAEFVSVHGESFIPEYCNPVRLRIAASQAVSMPVPGRKTSRLKATKPSLSWLPVMEAMLRELEQSRDQRGPTANPQLIEAIETGHALLAELRAAIAEKRPALVFRGYRPAELSHEVRSALVQRMTEHETHLLHKLHPALWSALAGQGQQ